MEIRGAGCSWAVYDGDRPIAEASHYDVACAKANRLERERHLSVRICLGCGCGFPSTGPGHRRCDSCQKQRPNSDGSDTRTDEKPVTLKMPFEQWVNGAPRRTRTADLLITNQLLYQLSYRG